MRNKFFVTLFLLFFFVFSCEFETKNDKEQILHIVFDTNSGVVTEKFSQRIIKGERVSKPSDPVKEGYTFIGWYTTKDEDITINDIPFDWSSKVFENLTLYAKYIPGAVKKIMYTDGTFSSEYIKSYPILGIITEMEIDGVDYITVYRNGIQQQKDTFSYIYNHPVNKFVAGFIGSPPMNFLNVKIMEKGGKLVADEGSFEITPTEEQAKTLKEYIGKEVYFGIRPEDMEYSKAPASVNNMQMKVSVIEPLGAETNLFLQSKTQQVVVRIDPDIKFELGDTVNFVPLMEKAKFFDKDTELNICETVRDSNM